MQEAKSIEQRLKLNEAREKQEEVDGDHRYHEQEKRAKEQFDAAAA